MKTVAGCRKTLIDNFGLALALFKWISGCQVLLVWLQTLAQRMLQKIQLKLETKIHNLFALKFSAIESIRVNSRMHVCSHRKLMGKLASSTLNQIKIRCIRVASTPSLANFFSALFRFRIFLLLGRYECVMLPHVLRGRIWFLAFTRSAAEPAAVHFGAHIEHSIRERIYAPEHKSALCCSTVSIRFLRSRVSVPFYSRRSIFKSFRKRIDATSTNDSESNVFSVPFGHSILRLSFFLPRALPHAPARPEPFRFTRERARDRIFSRPARDSTPNAFHFP